MTEAVPLRSGRSHDSMDNFLAQQALKGLAMRIERATLCWETPLTCEESLHIATSLLTMLFPAPLMLPVGHTSLAERAVKEAGS